MNFHFSHFVQSFCLFFPWKRLVLRRRLSNSDWLQRYQGLGKPAKYKPTLLYLVCSLNVISPGRLMACAEGFFLRWLKKRRVSTYLLFKRKLTKKLYLIIRTFRKKDRHYHLELQANPKKIVQKTDAIFSIYGRNGIIPWHFFFNSHLGLSRLLRSNDNRCWILRLGPRNFVIISESLAPNLEKVR